MNQQNKLFTALTSQVGRKLLTGITGVLLVLFVIGHLSGNLSILSPNHEAFNRYTLFLHNFGTLLYVVEILLAVTILLHAYIGVTIFFRRQKARGQGYAVDASKGGPSKKSISSRSMIVTGTVLLAFLVIHIVQFRFGPYLSTTLDGHEARDLRRLVIDTFQSPVWVIVYCGVMILLAFHLRHGIWSALQSLGAMRPRYTPVIYTIALLLGLLLAIGFFVLPIAIYMQGGAA